MSKLCRICGNEMPKDRKGADQVCPRCIKDIKTLRSNKDEDADPYTNEGDDNVGYETNPNSPSLDSPTEKEKGTL